MKKYGLIGHPLNHSFSQRYFKKKFLDEGLNNCIYTNYDLNDLNELTDLLINNNELEGLNITIPYKEKVIPFLDGIDDTAKKIGSVNVIKFLKGKLIGYNSDYIAFRETLKKWLPNLNYNAIILGSGGSSKAVMYALIDLGIPFYIISRRSSLKTISYQELKNKKNLLSKSKLIINTTPLGMYPNVNSLPKIPYELISNKHYLYDLVYNPEKTKFLKMGEKNNSKIKNGLEMLYLQANLSWNYWNK